MGWQSRKYSRRGWGRQEGWGGDLFSRLARLLNWSFPVGRIWGIVIHVHITFVVLVALELLQAGRHGSFEFFWVLRWTSLLFGSVLLHEFGHALACRQVGGSADHILMWPLGGLAYCSPPHRPWPEFVTVVWGPMVNLLLAVGSYLSLALWLGAGNPISLNPFTPWVGGYQEGWVGLIGDIFVVNYLLFLFNMALLCYPFDAGRLLQIALWVPMGYRRSMLLSCTWGMVGATAAGLFGLYQNNWLLFFIALFGFLACYQQRQQMLLESEYDTGQTVRPKGWWTRWREARDHRLAARKAAERELLQGEVDRILAKVHDSGLASLTEQEKRTLQRATELEQETSRPGR